MKGLLLATAAIGLTASAAQATTFTFNDEYYLSAGTAFSSVFAGATGSASTKGIYQETSTTAPTITFMSNGSSVPGEYVQNTTPNASQELITNGFTQSLNNKQQVANVFNSTLSGFLRYQVSGTTTPFTFNSFDLKGSGSITIRGELNLNPVAGDLATINLTSTITTYTFNWAGIDTVDFISGFIGGNQVTMDNVVVNNAVPEPGALALLGTVVLGLIGLRRRVA